MLGLEPIILLKVDLLNFSIYCNIMQNPPKKLLEQVRDIIRLKHYSYRTEETYVQYLELGCSVAQNENRSDTDRCH